MQQAAPGYRSYFLGAPHLYVENGVIRFIAEGAEKVNVLDEVSSGRHSRPRASPVRRKGRCLWCCPTALRSGRRCEAELPPGEEKAFYDTRGELLFKTYRVDGASSRPATDR